MLTHSFYESDNRVMRYAETLAARGDEVEVLALRRSPELPREEVLRGVRVIRIQDRFGKKEKSKASFLLPLLKFLMVGSWRLGFRHLRKRYDLLHVHNVPDFLVFAALLPRLTGARVILDIHDILPEFFASKFNAGETSKLVKGLRLIEKCSARVANHVILANDLWLDKYCSRSAPHEKCSVFINNVDAQIFRPRQGQPRSEKPVVLFPGGLQWHQGVDIALRAFAKARARLPEAQFHIYGDGNMKPQLVQLAQELGLNGSVRFESPRPLREIAEIMAAADLGVVPKRADSFGNEAYSTKIMEFMSVGVPVVIADTKIDRFYFNEGVVRFFPSGNADSLAEAMCELLSNPRLSQRQAAAATEYAARHCWSSRAPEYLRLVDGLCRKRQAT